MANFAFRVGLLERFRRLRSRSAGDGVRNPADADYLVKMNLPPMLGRRDAACEYIQELLKQDFSELAIADRRREYHAMLELLEYALADTEAVALMLASAETSARENRLHAFLSVLHDLISAALTLAQATEPLREANSPLSYFLPGNAKLNRYVGNADDAERRSLALAQELIEQGKAKLELYSDYNRKSFSTTNAERYKRAFDEFGARYRRPAEPTH